MPLIRKTPGNASPAAPASPVTVESLTRGSDDERWAAARAAASDPEAVAALAVALGREHNPRVREAMLTSLSRIGTAQSVEALVPLLRSDDSAVRAGALDALRATKAVVRPYVAELVRDADSDVRLLACELVRTLPSEDASALLCALLDAEREPNVCASAIEVLAEVGGADALPVLARCAERFADVPFLAFSIRVTSDRIRSQSTAPRG
jgi:HEAT repeat protein